MNDNTEPENSNCRCDDTGTRKPYVSPTIHFTEIEPEQALMGFCKTNGQGFGPTMCSTCKNSGS